MFKVIIPFSLIHTDIVEKALFESDINGPLSDLLCFLLTSIFSCIDEEEAEEQELEEKDKQTSASAAAAASGGDDQEIGAEMSYKELLTSATAASQICQINHGKLCVLVYPFDGLQT